MLQGGRQKAYRPLPEVARRAALDAGLAAYARDAWFLAHELLEPAWMGTDALAERQLYQGVIKVAAAHVHRERGNARGMAKNLVGARTLLVEALAGGAPDVGLDLPTLIADVDDRLARLARLDGRSVLEVPVISLPRQA